MKISVPCPESVRVHLSPEDANNYPAEGITIDIDGGLLSFEFSGANLAARIESIRNLDSYLGLAIAEDDRPEIIRALSDLKATVLGVETIVIRESSYTIAQSENAPELVAEATTTDVESHLQGEQHASSEGSSERHGVAPENEENLNVEAEEEKRPRKRTGRR